MSFSQFHPAVSHWFESSFDASTEVQLEAWKHIHQDKHTLIAAPTGSGKTLAGFLAVINKLVEKQERGELEQKTYVVYVSPLKALSNDIEKNLQFPLNGIKQEFKNLGKDLELTAKVRTGDTTQSERTGMLKNPPHILVTTPESLFLLLTSVKGREMLQSVETLIMDEIHAVVEDKRGSHLSVTIERLEQLTAKKLLRIGISATQKPIEETAKYLVGASNFLENGAADCEIVDVGHKRALDLQIELPNSPLTAVMANEVWEEIYDGLVKLIETHKTTLIFVNTRKLAERLAHDLSLRLGEEAITAHHGSLSKEQRLSAETKLKSGQLKALVATASLELGIDIGYIDLVCQISSPRKISAFLQRIGRAGHQVGGTPKGRIIPLTRDDLVECTALLDSIRRGELDTLVIPEAPIDILSQQIIATLACEESDEDELYALMSQAYSFRNLTRKQFNNTLEMLTTGFTNRRGYKRAYLHRDVVNSKVRARKGARLAVLTSGGAIPDLFDYDVILEPSGTYVGSLNEDFAIESGIGDIFQLGNSSWRVIKVEEGKVRVEDASGLPPTLPFWLGEAPGRSVELSEAVSRLRSTVNGLIDIGAGVSVNPSGELESNLPQTGRETDYDHMKLPALAWLVEEVGIRSDAAEQLVAYLLNAKLALGIIPTQKTLVLERFFDEVGDMHLILHSCFGSDVNTAWGLALRKRFCRGFNFELQAAATEDAIILSLSQTHSFPLEDIFNYLKSKTVRHLTTQAMLDNPIFEIRWRWNATRAMAILRNRAGKKVPAQFQRMESEDFIALAFPDQIACLENIVGDRDIPDHPLVQQTIHDCLTEAMDIDLLEDVLRRKEAGEIELRVADLKEPSPLAQEIINARPYAFLDDAPLEERRTRAIKNRRWLDPADAQELGRLDPEVIKLVSQEAWPRVDDADDLHDALVLLGYLTEKEIEEGNGEFSWKVFLNQLLADNRVTLATISEDIKVWVAAERLPQFLAIFPKAPLSPKLQLPESLTEKVWVKEDAALEIMRGRMESTGPTTVNELAETLAWDPFLVEQALLGLENQGFVFRGNYTGNTEETEWCERRLLHRIHRYTLQALRKEIEPIPAQDFMRFLFEWHRLNPQDQPEGPQSLIVILEQLEGYEVAAGAWETEVIAPRLANYDPSWMDIMSLSGRVVWGRLKPFISTSSKRTSPIKTTPILLMQRQNLRLWKNQTKDQEEGVEMNSDTQLVKSYLEVKGAQFFFDIVEGTKLLRTQVETALDELAAFGLVTSDSFTGLRALLTPVNNRPQENGLRRNNRKALFGMDHAGRWSLLAIPKEEKVSQDAEMEKLAFIYLKRYGVIFRSLFKKEAYAPKWRDLVRVLRRLEARGEIRGGYFISGMSGEQYALPEVISQLRAIRKKEKSGLKVTISACDPLNLTGIVTPGKHISQYPGNRIMYVDGAVVAIKEGDEIKYLVDLSNQEAWDTKNEILRKINPQILRAYLGKGFR